MDSAPAKTSKHKQPPASPPSTNHKAAICSMQLINKQQAVIRFLQPIKQQPLAFHGQLYKSATTAWTNNEPESQADREQTTSGL